MALAIHGYHLGIEDEAIYLPAVKKLLNPALFPRDAAFFVGQTRATALPYLLAASVRLTRLPVAWAVFLWQMLSIYLFLLASYRFLEQCIESAFERLAALALFTAFLTLPVAGTGLYLVDQHLHPRTLASAAILLSLAAALHRKLLNAMGWLLASVFLHPLMAMFGAALVILVWLPARAWPLRFLAVSPLFFYVHLPDAWRQAVATRDHYLLTNWEWYEWLGAIAPVAILWAFSRLAKRNNASNMALFCSRLVLFSVVWLAIACAVALRRTPDTFLISLQPMRYLHLVYVFMVLFGGALLGRYVARQRYWVLLLLVLPVAGGMFYAQRDLFSSSRHIDWPFARQSPNRWVQAFLWIRSNTPQGAYFAIAPRYMDLRGEDHYGFRALAERSQMADISKDAAVVTLTPSLAPAWLQQIKATENFAKFGPEEFRALRREFGVDMLVVEKTQSDALLAGHFLCPYTNDLVAVCKIPD